MSCSRPTSSPLSTYLECGLCPSSRTDVTDSRPSTSGTARARTSDKSDEKRRGADKSRERSKTKGYNGASRASFHVTAGKMQHTVRNGAAHTASHLGPSTVGPRRLAFSFCSMSVKCSVPGVWSLRISALDSRMFCSFST